MNIKDFAEKVIKAEEEAWQKGNFEPLKAILDPNVLIHMPLGLPDTVGFESFKQQIIDARQNRSDIKQEWQYLTGEGNLLVLSYKASYSITGSRPGSRFKVGNKVSVDEFLVSRHKKGRVVEVWSKGQFTITD